MMIPSDHFVRFYNEVFKFLDEQGNPYKPKLGKFPVNLETQARDKVAQYRAKHPNLTKKQLENLRDCVREAL